jgi:hypothetical protein
MARRGGLPIHYGVTTRPAISGPRGLKCFTFQAKIVSAPALKRAMPEQGVVDSAAGDSGFRRRDNTEAPTDVAQERAWSHRRLRGPCQAFPSTTRPALSSVTVVFIPEPSSGFSQLSNGINQKHHCIMMPQEHGGPT